MARPIRTLLFSTLYPSSVRPTHGIFVETRLRELLRTGEVQSKVLAPVPWFPSTGARWGDYAKMAATPQRETRNGIDVLHPRYLVLPKIGMTVAPALLALGSVRAIQKVIDDGFDFDLIDAHYYYPDGVAAAWLARHFRKPLAITARGSDLNVIARYTLPRQQMKWAAASAEASIGVSNALMDVLRAWRVAEHRLHVMRNGVDLDRFHPMPSRDLRAALGLEGAPVFLSVGNMVENKGHHLVIEALSALTSTYPQARLVIVGDGVERPRLEAMARDLGVLDRVTMTGVVPQAELPRWYGVADVLVLASRREGWANVLLEAMACGTPVVATNIAGTREVVRASAAGRLIDERSGTALAAGLASLLAAAPHREDVRAYAEQFSWDDTSRSQLRLFRELTEARRA